MKKRLLSLGLAGCMVVSLLPGSFVTALDREANLSSSGEIRFEEEIGVMPISAPIASDKRADSKDSMEADLLEAVLVQVKKKISIPKDLTEFSYYYNSDSYSKGTLWNLTWHNEEYSKSISVRSDGDGNIQYYNENIRERSSAAPKYLKEELEGTALSFIKKIAPQIAGKLKYNGEAESSFYGGQYQYTFYRVENGIPMTDNAVTVGVNYSTGKVMSYSSNYLYQIEIPAGDVKISQEKAKEIIGEQVKMKLSYRPAYHTDSKGNTTIKAFLVYTPDNSYIAVDAKTGEVYTTKSVWRDSVYDMSSEEGAKLSGSGELSPLELAEIEKLKDIITKEEAIAIVTNNKNLHIDSNAKAITASLLKENNKNKESSYVWNISFSDPREADYETGDKYRAYASARVDGKTGIILSFYASVKDYNEMTKKEIAALTTKYDLEAGQKILEGFLKEQIPEKFNSSKFLDNSIRYIIFEDSKKEIPRLYNYNYNRVNQGIDYDYNQINGTVDGVTGKITSFSYSWDDNITFESPKNIMDANKAFDHYMSKEGFRLNYEINTNHIYNNTDYKVIDEVRLVYSTNISPNYISPFTGKQLDYNGEEYVKEGKKYNYNDITGHKLEREIKLLGNIGIGFTGGNFLPDKAITGGELNEILLAIGYYNNAALKQDSKITRMEVSELLIKLLGYEKVAAIKGIYSMDLEDKEAVSEEKTGVVSIINGLKLVTVNEKNEFRPKDHVTREETVQMVMELFGLQN